MLEMISYQVHAGDDILSDRGYLSSKLRYESWPASTSTTVFGWKILLLNVRTPKTSLIRIITETNKINRGSRINDCPRIDPAK